MDANKDQENLHKPKPKSMADINTKVGLGGTSEGGNETSARPIPYRYSLADWFSSNAGNKSPIPNATKETGDKSAFISRLPATGLPEKPPRIVHRLEDYMPKRHKAKVVVWADLTVDAIDRLSESLNADHIKQVLADIFVLDNYKTNMKTAIVMDLYFYTLQFAREMKFSPEKTSAFFSIIKKIFGVCIETPFGNLDHTFEYFKDLLLCHSVNRPPYSIELFTPDEVRRISEYTINSFFRHFKMYKYAFTPLVRLDLSINYVGMPPSPPPSEDGKDTETLVGDDEVDVDGEKAEEIDEERQAAREELRNVVKTFLTGEGKKIEGNVEQQIKTAVEALNAKIDTMIETQPKGDGKKKK